jgi:hypothetical protein
MQLPLVGVGVGPKACSCLSSRRTFEMRPLHRGDTVRPARLNTAGGSTGRRLPGLPSVMQNRRQGRDFGVTRPGEPLIGSRVHPFFGADRYRPAAFDFAPAAARKLPTSFAGRALPKKYPCPSLQPARFT